MTVLCGDAHLALNKLAKPVCGVVFCVSKVLRNYMYVCRSLNWAMLNAGEVMIPWELQVGKFHSRFRNFILSLCEK